MSPTTLLYGVLVLALVCLYFKWRPAQATWQKAMESQAHSLLAAGAGALLIIAFVARTYYIPSESMTNTLQVHDHLLVNEWVYHFYQPARGDIVVFNPPPAANEGDKQLIKRIVAVAGDTVSMHHDVVYINGQAMAEAYKNLTVPGGGEMAPVKVPPGMVWAMGDNRHNSFDSRYWGPLPVGNIVGKAAFVYYPLGRMQELSRG